MIPSTVGGDVTCADAPVTSHPVMPIAVVATIAERLYFLQKSLGAVPGPFDSWLLLRGLKTLGVRMRQHCANADAGRKANHQSIIEPGRDQQHHADGDERAAVGGEPARASRSGIRTSESMSPASRTPRSARRTAAWPMACA